MVGPVLSCFSLLLVKLKILAVCWMVSLWIDDIDGKATNKGMSTCHFDLIPCSSSPFTSENTWKPFVHEIYLWKVTDTQIAEGLLRTQNFHRTSVVPVCRPNTWEPPNLVASRLFGNDPRSFGGFNGLFLLAPWFNGQWRADGAGRIGRSWCCGQDIPSLSRESTHRKSHRVLCSSTYVFFLRCEDAVYIQCTSCSVYWKAQRPGDQDTNPENRFLHVRLTAIMCSVGGPSLWWRGQAGFCYDLCHRAKVTWSPLLIQWRVLYCPAILWMCSLQEHLDLLFWARVDRILTLRYV